MNNTTQMVMSVGEKQSKSPITPLTKDDLIYENMFRTPIVIPEYKLIFFPMPKVACTQFKLMMRQLMHNPFPDYLLKYDHLNNHYLHNPEENNLTTLRDFSVEEAEEMMNSPDWTRTVFLREPKERILSAFLDKFVHYGWEHFTKSCCHRLPSKERREECLSHIFKSKSFCDSLSSTEQEGCFATVANTTEIIKEFPYFLNMTQQCSNAHWLPQYSMVDTKWWPKMNYVGYMHTMEKDAQVLLQGLKSTTDGVSAWDKYGKTGWGENKTESFLMEKNKISSQESTIHNRLRRYYSVEDEKFVEEHWAIEWNQTYFQFDRIDLYPKES